MSLSASDTSARPERYYHQGRSEMLKYVPAHVKRTLELGCAAGHFSEHIKAERHAECWGVEMDRQAARIAEAKLDRIITEDITRCLADIPDHYFDCIICNDILEHLVDPFGLLIAIREKLTPDGVLVASLPNIRYARVFFDFVWRGNWDYREHGIMDKTHLRFFTYKSIVKMFPALGYDLLTIEGIESEPSALSRLAKLVNLLLLNKFRDTLYHHFACVAKPVRRPISR